MKESNVNYEQLQKTFMELNELKCILRKTQSFFEEVKYVLYCLVNATIENACFYYFYHQ